MPSNSAKKAPNKEAEEVGRAIQTLRERVGISQEELADRMGMARQTVSRYEAGRPIVLRTDIQRSIVSALGLQLEDLMGEVDNLVHFPGFPRGSGDLPLQGLRRPSSVVAVEAVPSLSENGDVRYELAASSATEDLGWLFGPSAGYLRLAEGAFPDGAFTGRVAGYDRSTWPRKGQACVVETREGELLPGVYEGPNDAGTLVRAGGTAGLHTIPKSKIKGVYAIRFWGD